MKKKLLAVLLIVLIVFCPIISACSDSKAADSEPLTFYCVNEWDALVEFIKKYNKYCAINDNYEDRVEIINFESLEELEAQFSTELMAGGGADIISLDQSLPFEKLVNNDSLMDINQLIADYGNGFSLDNCNQVIMNSGVFDGKRYLLPLYYNPDYLATTQQQADAFGVDLNSITYDSLIQKFNPENPEYYLISPYYALHFYYSFIRDFADFESGTNEFDTDEFRYLAENFRYMILYGGDYKTYNAYDEQEDGSDYLFSSMDSYLGGGSFSTVSRIYSHSLNTLTDLSLYGIDQSEIRLFPNYSKDNQPTACVSVGLAINANCKKQDKAMKLIEYMLSFDAQSYWCGGRDYESVSSDYNLAGLPVNNDVFEASFKNAVSEVYDADLDGRITTADEEIAEDTNGFLTEEYLPLLKSISKCDIYDFDSLKCYYVRYVIRDIVEQYLREEISTDKFISKLVTATELYMTE